MDNINNCTRCGAEFTDFKIDISFNIKVIRSQEDGFWEYIPNLDNTSREVLCFNCFTKFRHGKAFRAYFAKYADLY